MMHGTTMGQLKEQVEKEMSTIGELYGALAKAQGEFKEIKRTKTVKIKMKNGGEFAYKYAPLDAIRKAVQPALSAHDLSVFQVIEEKESGTYLVTGLGHKSGAQISSSVFINTKVGDPKSLGALISYYRRYGLSALLGVASEDDDERNLDAFKASEATMGRKKPLPKDSSPLTQQQLKWFGELLGKKNWNREQAGEVCQSIYGHPDYMKLNRGQMGKIVTVIQSKTYDDWKTDQEISQDIPEFNSDEEIPF